MPAIVMAAIVGARIAASVVRRVLRGDVWQRGLVLVVEPRVLPAADLHVALADDDARRLEVAMDDAAGMRAIDQATCLGKRAQHVGRRRPRDELRQRYAERGLFEPGQDPRLALVGHPRIVTPRCYSRTIERAAPKR